jgi:hypothetical protein
MSLVKLLVGAVPPIQLVPVANAVVAAVELQSIVALQALTEKEAKMRKTSANVTGE